MSTILFPTPPSSVHAPSPFTAPLPPGHGHPLSPINYAPGAGLCADEPTDPADREELLLDPPTPSVENRGHALPTAITRKNKLLSEQEQQTLRDCERTIRKGLQAFFEVGQALLQIQDGRLYRQTHSTFEAYCRECFGLSHSHAYRHIEGAKVLQHLSPIGDKPMPVNEAQTRPLVPLRPEDRIKVWRRVLNTTSPRQITAKVVELAVKEFLRSKQAGPGQQGEPPGDAVIEIDADVLRVVTDPGTNEVKAGAHSPLEALVLTECAPPSTMRPSAGSNGLTREAPSEPSRGPTSVRMGPSDAVAPPTRSCATPPVVGEAQPSPDAALKESNLAMPPEGKEGDGGELTEFRLADGSTARVPILSGQRPTADEILGSLAFIAKTYPNLQPPVSRPELIKTQRLVLECAAQINRLIGDWPRVELSRAVQRLGGELNDLIVRPRQA